MEIQKAATMKQVKFKWKSHAWIIIWEYDVIIV